MLVVQTRSNTLTVDALCEVVVSLLLQPEGLAPRYSRLGLEVHSTRVPAETQNQNLKDAIRLAPVDRFLLPVLELVYSMALDVVGPKLGGNLAILCGFAVWLSCFTDQVLHLTGCRLLPIAS